MTSKARTNIRHFLKTQKRDESVALGRRLLGSALSTFSHTLETISEEHIAQIIEELGAESFDSLLEEFGLGSRVPQGIARRLAVMTSGDEDAPSDQSNIDKLAIRGTEGMVISYAKCCSPIPGDDIVGYASAGRGLVVHTVNCKNMLDLLDQADKCIHLNWDSEITEDFSVRLRIWIQNGRGLVAQLASAVTEVDGNLQQINIEDHDANLSVVSIRVGVQDRLHLARIMKRLRSNKAVTKIVRLKNANK